MRPLDDIREEELAPGAHFKLRRPSAVRKVVVEAAAAEAAAKLASGSAVLADYGFDANDFGLLGDQHVFLGLMKLFKACGWGEALIVEWRFDGLPPEETPALTRENIRLVLNTGLGDQPPLFEALLEWAERPFRMRRAEGNVSAPAPNGTTAAGATSAGAAN